MRRRRDLPLLLLVAALPVLAHAPALRASRLLGPGDGAELHFPLRAAVWDAYRGGDLPSWNPGIFLGTPLLASYRPGAFYPPMFALAALPSFQAFQFLVAGSLAAAGALVFVYVRRLGAARVGAFVAGMCFSLGPYLVGHLGDTATIVAAPLLPLLLIAAEAHVTRATPPRAVGLALAFAAVILAGSPEATRAAFALLIGRLLVAHLMPSPRSPRPLLSVVVVAAGALLAAPQWLPSLLAAREAGRAVTGLAADAAPLPGFFGLILRYASHTPAPALAVAALPLAVGATAVRIPVRVLGVALLVSLALQWGRGPLAAAGALALVFDLTLCILAGLSLSAQWRARREPAGARLRAYFLVASLAAAAALSVAAAALGPLPETLAAAVGVLAVSLILYFSLATSPHALRAGIWLLPLAVSFVLQPHGRSVWRGAPTRTELLRGSATRDAVRREMGGGERDRMLTLARRWPRGREADLAYGNRVIVAGGRSANGYDPLVPLRTRAALGAMSVGGVLPGAFFRSDPARLALLGIRWVQAPADALAAETTRSERLDAVVGPGERRLFPFPIVPATGVELVSSLSEGEAIPQGTPVATVRARLASTGRELEMTVRAGEHTAEWALDRPDVFGRAAHSKARIAESWIGPGGGFRAHLYEGSLELPGRYYIDGLTVERLPGKGALRIAHLTAVDATAARATSASLAAAYVSDVRHLTERAATPGVRLFEAPAGVAARVVERLRVLPDDAAVLDALGAASRHGIDPRREALATAADAAAVGISGGRASRGEVVRSQRGRVDIRAEGPGVLVAAVAWDRGWTAHADGREVGIVRVNHAEMGIPLPAGLHRVELRHTAYGLRAGLALFALGAAGLGGAFVLARAHRRPRRPVDPSPSRVLA
jgi:hypothetical protein